MTKHIINVTEQGNFCSMPLGGLFQIETSTIGRTEIAIEAANKVVNKLKQFSQYKDTTFDVEVNEYDCVYIHSTGWTGHKSKLAHVHVQHIETL